jgi:tRNA modification GTPase
MMETDPIAAVATPPGVAAVAIIRISGPAAREVGDRCFEAARPEDWPARMMRRGWIRDLRSGDRVDDALAVFFAAPSSYTGEDVVELHVHGGSGVVASCLSLVLAGGARLAQPGEFTRRAFVNGRMDLTQAEAVADLIGAESKLAARAAATRLEGAGGRLIRELRSELLARLIEIEAHVDYPDEVPEPDPGMIARCVRAQQANLAALLAGSGPAKALRDGIDCVIAGPPNAGKSSLLNALLDAERAIVSDVPGTTRDVIEDRVAVDGVVLRLRDTAGLRSTTDVIEAEGVARATRAIDEASLVILVLDGSRALGADELAAIAATNGRPRIVLSNKGDLGDAGLRELRVSHGDATGQNTRHEFVAGSVRLRSTIDGVRAAIARLGWGGGVIDANAALVANSRQIEAIVRAAEALDQAAQTIDARRPIDLLTVDLRGAIAAYGEVTGETVTDEVLDGIFSRFCVGK